MELFCNKFQDGLIDVAFQLEPEITVHVNVLLREYVRFTENNSGVLLHRRDKRIKFMFKKSIDNIKRHSNNIMKHKFKKNNVGEISNTNIIWMNSIKILLKWNMFIQI